MGWTKYISSSEPLYSFMWQTIFPFDNEKTNSSSSLWNVPNKCQDQGHSFLKVSGSQDNTLMHNFCTLRNISWLLILSFFLISFVRKFFNKNKQKLLKVSYVRIGRFLLNQINLHAKCFLWTNMNLPNSYGQYCFYHEYIFIPRQSNLACAPFMYIKCS